MFKSDLYGTRQAADEASLLSHVMERVCPGLKVIFMYVNICLCVFKFHL